MLILTIQKREFIESIKKGEYRAELWESPYAFLNTRFTESYKRVITELNKKTKSTDTSCLWGWVQNPYLEFFPNLEDYVAVFVNVPMKNLVLTDYDKFTDYCIEESRDNDFFVDTPYFRVRDCIQCTFKSSDISTKNIKGIVSATMLQDIKYGSIEDLFIFASTRNVFYTITAKKLATVVGSQSISVLC